VVAERRVGERDQSLGRVRRIVTPGSARSGGALIAVRLGLALAVLSVLVGALPAVGDVIAPPPTASAYAYDSAAAVAHGAAESTPLAAVATAAVSGGSRAVRENSADFRGFGVAAEGAADDWPVISGIVRDSAKSKGNFGLGEGTASQATRAGESWVGDGYRVASDGKTLVSRDGLRTFRPPSWKPDLGKYQANFEYWLEQRVGKPFGNGHLDITDLGP
jgi:Na+-transporting methylmalonyl-CoA/oxaloacetate decarboxylase gamma subunit